MEEFISPNPAFDIAEPPLVAHFQKYDFHDTPMTKRSNTINAAAMSLGISPDLLESVLPTLREITEVAKKAEKGHTNARIEFPQPTVHYTVSDTHKIR